MTRRVGGSWAGLALSVLVALVTGQAHAQGVCYRYSNAVTANGVTGLYFNSPEELLAAVLEYRATHGVGCESGNTANTGGPGEYCDTFTNEGCDAFTPPAGTVCRFRTVREPRGSASCSSEGGSVNCNPSGLQGVTVSSEVNPLGCPTEECTTEPYNFTAGNVSGPNRYCNAVELCVMQVLSRTGDTMTIRNTGQTCDPDDDLPPPPEDMPPDPPDDGSGNESCQAVGDAQYCASSSGDGDCGYLNDTYICLNKIRDDECKVLGDGSRMCGQKAGETTPPAPDNGTPGQPATPDGQLTHETPDPNGGPSTPNTYNYYNTGTVAGSSRDPGTTGENAAAGSGSPNGGGSSSGEGDGSEGGTCTGDMCGAGVPDLEDVGTMQEAFEGFWADLQEVPIVAAASNAAPELGGGTCPVWSWEAEFYGQPMEVEFSVICEMFEEGASLLTPLCLVFWGLLCFRILMSA